MIITVNRNYNIDISDHFINTYSDKSYVNYYNLNHD